MSSLTPLAPLAAFSSARACSARTARATRDIDSICNRGTSNALEDKVGVSSSTTRAARAPRRVTRGGRIAARAARATFALDDRGVGIGPTDENTRMDLDARSAAPTATTRAG